MVVAAGLLALAGLLVAGAATWRQFETVLSAGAMHAVIGQRVVADPGNVILLYRGHVLESALLLTSECSVGYLVAALLVGTTPFVLASRIPWLRVGAALVVGALVLLAVNVARLTSIGLLVHAWGPVRGFEVGHTYLGSLLTFLGTSVAGLCFAAVLLVRRREPERSAGSEKA